MKRHILRLLPLLDRVLVPLVYPAGWLLGLVRRIGVHRLPASKSALLRVGVFPIRNHYYEPQFDFRSFRQAFSQDRDLPGIDWNVDGQLDWLARLSSASEELAGIPQERPDPLDFYLNNEAFLSGDAEYWYALIRTTKPRRVFEVGSGHSTLMAAKAILRNRSEDPGYQCRHTCIEPYEAQWLEDLDVTVIRQKLEDLAPGFFMDLSEDDILFIDSSHIIRPDGDVLFEYLELLPSLRKGVIVHVHDIFSPRNYPAEWLADRVHFWNEQYLLEAFLSHNRDWKIIGALNYLHHHHYDELKAAAPYLTREREPGSFYLQKTG